MLYGIWYKLLSYVMLYVNLYVIYYMVYGIWHIVNGTWSMLNGMVYMVYEIWDIVYGLNVIMIFIVCIVMWLCSCKLVRIGKEIGEMN